MTAGEACDVIVDLLKTNRRLREELDSAHLLAERQAAGWRESIERNRVAYDRLRVLERDRRTDSRRAA